MPEEEIRSQLSRILQSGLFAQSDRLGRFLRFTVENALAGNAHILKEYVFSTEIYDRKAPYHPSQDSIVRTEARRLRAKLKEYYESCGKDEPIFIYLRLGTYVLVFRRQRLPTYASLSHHKMLVARHIDDGDAQYTSGRQLFHAPSEHDTLG